MTLWLKGANEVKTICSVAYIISKLGFSNPLKRNIVLIKEEPIRVIIVWKYPEAWSVVLRKNPILGVI